MISGRARVAASRERFLAELAWRHQENDFWQSSRGIINRMISGRARVAASIE